MIRTLTCLLVCTMLLIGCGDDDPADTDTSTDTTADTTGDTGGDTTGDTTGDTPGDMPGDVADDTSGDTQTDAGNDTTTDTVMDTADMGGRSIAEQFDALNDAITASGVSFCVCAGDATSNFCSVDATNCFDNPTMCEAEADGFQSVPPANRPCYVTALELDAASSASVSCLTTAYAAFTTCLDAASCDHTAMLACGTTWQEALQSAACELPPAVQTAVEGCMAP